MTNNPMINNMPPIHPGVILQEEFMKPMNLTLSDLSDKTVVASGLLRDICLGKKNVTPSLANSLSAALGTTPEFWLNLQQAYNEKI